MSAHATERGSPPDVDEGNPRDLAAWLVSELRPTPGRFGDSLRIVAMVLVVVTIGEVFRIPNIAVSAYIVLFLSGREAVSTVLTALIVGIAVVLAVFATIAVFMLSLSEPALRIPLMAALTFVAMFLSQASPLGPVFFAAGFIVAYGLTLGDVVLDLALQPATAGNATQFALPEIVFIPPPEALVRVLLWLSLAVVLPVAVLIAANLLAGRDPAWVLRRALAERLATAARFCAGESAAERQLQAQAFEGTAMLRKLHHLAGLLRRDRSRPLWDTSLIDAISRLGLLLLAWLRVEGKARDPLVPAVGFCRAAERALRDGEGPTANPVVITATGAAQPLANAISSTLAAIRDALTTSPETMSPREKNAARSPRRLLARDAFSNPEYARFALKVTLAVMVCYLAENLANWPGIHTSVITCFYVALGTVGETLHKATLRFMGCLIGAGLGLGAILLLMPYMTDLGDLLLLLAPVTLLAAWVAHGSERIAYAGLQIGIAFYLVVLQGYGPTIDMNTAKDRTIGILFGNLVIFVIFTTIWPVSVADVVRTNLAKALEQLASLLGSDARSTAATTFGQTIAQASAVLVNDPFEMKAVRQASRRRPIDAIVVEQVGWLFIPITEILELRTDSALSELPQPRQAAINVGIARSAYLPALTASVLAGYEHVVAPIPPSLVPQGFITFNAQEVFPQLAVDYLLLDFGGRNAAVEAAKQLSIAGNASFTATHQQVIFNVARAYFMLDGATAALRAAQQGLTDAQVVQRSAEALSGRGLATVVNVQIAQRDTAQAQFDLAQANAAQHDATYTLLAAMDLPPTTKLHVADASSRPLPPRTARTVDDVLGAALRNRPDLLADVAKLRATDANITAARSSLAPKLALSGNVQGNIGRLSVDGSPYVGVREPQGALLLELKWPLYQGGLLQNKLRLAESQRQEAAEGLKAHTDQAVREVALAYDQVETELQQYAAAVALQTASDAAFRSASDSYSQGIGTFTDATAAQTGLASARAGVARAHAQSLINAAALAFATGELTSSADFATVTPR